MAANLAAVAGRAAFGANVGLIRIKAATATEW